MQGQWMKRARTACAAFAAFCVAPAFAAGAEMIVNGSFESPAHDATGVYSGGGDGWISSFHGPVVVVKGNLTDGGGNKYGKTPYGKQYLGIDPRSSQGFVGANSQEIPGFVEGQQYRLTFNAADSDGGKAPQLEVMLSDGGDQTYMHRYYDLPVGGPYGDEIAFTKYKIVFRAKVTGTVVLTFRNTGDNITAKDPGSISIDKVSLVPLTEAEAAGEMTDATGPSSAFSR